MAKKGPEGNKKQTNVPANEYDRLVANGLKITVEGTGEEESAETKQEDLSAKSSLAEDKQKLQKALDSAIKRRNRQKEYYDFVVEKRLAKRFYAAKRLLSEANAELEELEKQLASLTSPVSATEEATPVSAATPVSESVTTSAKPATKKKKSVTEAPAGDADEIAENSAKGENPAEKTDLSLEEWQKIWKNDEKLFRQKEDIAKKFNKDKEPEAFYANARIADLFYHIVNQDRIMKGQELGSDIFNKAREERAGYVAKVEKLLDIKLDDPKATVAEEEKPEVKEETPKADDSVVTPAKVAEREVPAVESTGTLAAEEPAPVAPALTEAEKAFENAKLALLQKQDEKMMHERTKASWEREHEAAKASKGLKARKERARSKAEILAAQARADRAEDEIYFLNEIFVASDAWVAAEKEHGTDDLRSKNAEALYRSRLDNFETYRKATSKSGSTEQIKATENLSPAKPSKVKKVFAGIIGAVVAVGLAVGGHFAAKAIVNRNAQTPPEQTPIVTPEPEPETDDSISTPDSAGDEQLTEEQLSNLQGTMKDQNLIDSEKATISGLAGFAYRTEDGEQKTDIYIRTEAGTLIKYQSEFTKDEIAALRETGSTNADIANAILKTVNRKQATYYYRADESLAKLNEEAALRADGKLINAGQDAIGDYAVYYSIENTQDLVNANYHGSVDLVAIGDNSIVELDDFATYKTKTGSSFSVNDGGKEAVLAAVEKKLGGSASTSGFSGQVTIGSRVASAANVASTELSR